MFKLAVFFRSIFYFSLVTRLRQARVRVYAQKPLGKALGKQRGLVFKVPVLVAQSQIEMVRLRRRNGWKCFQESTN